MPRPSFDLIAAPPGSAADFRHGVEVAAREQAAIRLTELESQSSSVKDPRERIQIWERLHALRLPRTPGHVLVRVIAEQTRLTVRQVQEEQQRRATPAAAPVTVP
jgi:hypothetical protein